MEEKETTETYYFLKLKRDFMPFRSLDVEKSEREEILAL